ncbi:MAG: YihY family inner membrane protein [Ramlibacter sp.]
MDIRQLPAQLARFPWRPTALTLGERFREDRLALTASSLTFTTTMALVPFFTVVLAVFTAFPMFGKVQEALQTWLLQSLIPDAIARQVLGYLTQFSGKASRLGAFGLGVLLFTAFALVLTIDRTLNGIWRVKRPRPLARRLIVYWSVMTLGPLLLGASLSLSSYVLSASRGLVQTLPGTLHLVLNVIEFFLLAAGLAALYRYVPNTPVRRGHAWAGGLFAAVGIEAAKKMLALYLSKVPTYSLVYGTFATVPILLVWIYLVWIIVLLGAVIAAYLPSLVAGAHRRASAHGWQFQLALELLRELHGAARAGRPGLGVEQLVRALQLDALQLEPVLEVLASLGWIGRLNEADEQQSARYILLADVKSTALEPLMRHLLLPQSEATDKLWKSGRLSSVYLKDVI